MGYFYAIMWFVVGIVLFFSVSKENKIFYFAGAFFILLGAWWLADSILPENLFAGGWGDALRGVTLGALIVLSVVFFIERQKTIKREVLERKKTEEALQAEAERTGEVLPNGGAADAAPFPGEGEDSLRAGVAGVNIFKPRLEDDDGKENRESQESAGDSDET